MQILDVILPEVEEDGESEVYSDLLSPLKTVKVESAGRWFEAYCHRRNNKSTLSHHSARSSSSSESEGELSPEEEDDDSLLLTLDPKEWKNQDHYAVLGLSTLRCKATEEQIKRAYKKKVLKHHPDKRRARGLPVNDGEEDYFTCITRAWETLGVPVKRRSYDSIDPQFDDSVPQISQEAKDNFFTTFAPVFEINSRWSNNKKRIPPLGDDKSTYDEVNKFYAFWYDFDSWREYSYLDEEEKEKGENRDERRWIEKQNKAARQKRKKEELQRIRQLVDNAYACDPRIMRFKEEEKQKKIDQKRARQEAVRLKAEEEERQKQAVLEEERKIREKEEEEARIKAAVIKKEKEIQKKAMKKEKKTLRTVVKEQDYFANNDDNEKVRNMQELDKLTEWMSLLSLQNLNVSLTGGDIEVAKNAFYAQVKEMNIELEKEKRQHLDSHKQNREAGGASSSKSKTPWTSEEIPMLIKAVNLFPAGTIQRWETVAEFISQHVPDSKRTAKEVLAKAKDLQKNDSNMKEEANMRAFDKVFKESKSAVQSAAERTVISERFDSVADQQIGETGSNPAPWTGEEQKLLEQSLKTFPASTPERWERISEVVPNRSKKDCMKRYKELVEMVKAKKAAQAAAQAKAKK